MCRTRIRATPSWPVEIQVSPQHTGRCGVVTPQPARSSTCTAAIPTSGWKWLVNVSGHSSTVPRAPAPGAGVWPASQRCSDCGANRGTSRSSRPAMRVPSRRSGRTLVAALTAGASRSRSISIAAVGSQPVA